MSGDEAQLALEQAHLKTTVAAFRRALEQLRKPARGGDEIAQEALDIMRRERIRAYTEATGPLYFGRIDRDGGTVTYVGRHAVADERNRLLSINWRAPAAAPFYAAGSADPHGLVLRRRFEIDEDEVLGFVDEEFGRGDSGEDALTAAIIEDVTRRRVGFMRQIIATITPFQYGMIRAEPQPTLIVQGGPGTGKTAVGLHRAAWLLYDRPEIRRQGVLIVGPNPAFMRYISHVLPALGENTVQQREIGAVVSTAAPTAVDPPELLTLKASGRMAVMLERLLWQRLRTSTGTTLTPFPRTPEVIITARDVSALVHQARATSRSYRAAGSTFRLKLAQLIASRVSADADVLASSDELVTAVRKDPGFGRFATSVWPSAKPETLVGSLYRNRKRLGEASAGLLADEELELLLRSAPPKRRQDTTMADDALLDEARWLIDPDQRAYGHIVVDEAQNLTEMELRMLVRRARGQSLTVLGDISQRTMDAHGGGWESLLAAAGVRERSIETLTTSYRVPADFLRLAARVLDDASDVPDGVREASWPAVAIDAGQSLATAAVELARQWTAVLGSTALLVPDVFLDAVVDALAGVPHNDGRTSMMTSGINLLDLRSMKGLEIDAVIVLSPTEILAQPVDGGPGALYTALTRSTQALAIVHEGALPAPLTEAAELRHVGLAEASVLSDDG